MQQGNIQPERIFAIYNKKSHLIAVLRPTPGKIYLSSAGSGTAVEHAVLSGRFQVVEDQEVLLAMLRSIKDPDELKPNLEKRGYRVLLTPASALSWAIGNAEEKTQEPEFKAVHESRSIKGALLP